MTRDVGTEESTDPEPLRPAGEQTTDREDKSRVEPPHDPPEGVRRKEELEAGHCGTGLDDPRQLAKGRLRIIDVAQKVGEGQRVEGLVRERQLLGSPSTSWIRVPNPAAATFSRP